MIMMGGKNDEFRLGEEEEEEEVEDANFNI